MKKLYHWLLALLFVTTVGGASVAIAIPQTTFAATACNDRLLTFPTWYNGLTNSKCEITAPTGAGSTGLNKFIWTIALNIVEIILQLVAYITVGFIIVGGYKYMISAGSSDGMVKARKTITNAIVGLLLSMLSVLIVNIISGAIK